MKKNISLLLAGMMLIASSTGQLVSASEAAEVDDSLKGTTITAMIQNTWCKDAFRDVVDYVNDKTGITLELEVLPDGNEGESVIKAKNASGEMSDILIYQPGAFFRMLNPTENYVDVTDESFAQTIVEGYDLGFRVDDRLYGIPYVGFGSSLTGIFYNKKVFDQLGITELPNTWEEMETVCEKILAEGDGITPVYCSGKDGWTNQIGVYNAWVWELKDNPDALEAFCSGEQKFSTSDNFIEGMGIMKKLVDAGYCNEDAASATYETAQQALCEGSAAMYVAYSFVMDNIYASYPEYADDIGAFPIPCEEGDGGVCLLSPGGIYISNTTTQLDAVRAWLDCYVTGEAQDVYYESLMGFPMYEGVSKAEVYPVVQDLYKYVEEGNYAGEAVAYFPVQFTELEQIAQSVAVGGVSPEEACEKMDKNFSDAMKLIGAAGW